MQHQPNDGSVRLIIQTGKTFSKIELSNAKLLHNLLLLLITYCIMNGTSPSQLL